MAEKYNYKEAIELIIDRLNSDNKVVTYDELEKTLGLEAPLGMYNVANSNVIARFKKYLKNKDIRITSAMPSRPDCINDISKYRYYSISKIDKQEEQNDCEKEDNSYKQLAEENESKKYKNKCIVLERDNQKLFLELEEAYKKISELEDENARLGLHNCELGSNNCKLHKKEQEYINVICSLSNLLSSM